MKTKDEIANQECDEGLLEGRQNSFLFLDCFGLKIQPQDDIRLP